MYAILPYDKLDKHGNALFKVGQADSFRKRIEQYHTYYPNGVYIKSLLKNPRTQFKRDENNKRINISLKQYYNKVESFLHKDIVEKGGKQLRSTTRIADSKNHSEGLGKTEWFYTNQHVIDDAFNDTNNKFGGSVYNAHLNNLNSVVNRERKKDKKNKNITEFKAEIYYKIK